MTSIKVIFHLLLNILIFVLKFSVYFQILCYCEYLILIHTTNSEETSQSPSYLLTLYMLLSLPVMPFPAPQHPSHPRPTALCLSGFLINYDALEVIFLSVSSTYHVCVLQHTSVLQRTSPTKLFLISEYECYTAIAFIDQNDV